MGLALVEDRGAGVDASVGAAASVGADAEPATMAEVASAVVHLRSVLLRLDPSTLSGSEAARGAETVASLEKALVATRCRLALRAADCGEHTKAGSHSAADWMGRMAGVTREEARSQLAAVESSATVPGLAGAVASGSLSWRQAGEIAETEALVPGSGSDLLRRARGASLKWLRDEARRVREAAVTPEDLAARQRAARGLRTWKDKLGMIRGTFGLCPIEGVSLLKRLQAETDRRFRAARRAGDDETTSEQLAADALVRLLNGEDGFGSASGAGPGSASRGAEVVVVADLASLLTGSVQPGGTCHVMGGSPIPVSEAVALAQGAFIKAVLHDGTEVTHVAHYGRRRKLPAVLATALRLGAPPLFHGVACQDGCGCELGLQWDHIDPVANGGPTSMANLQGLCKSGHKAKTARDRAAGLLGHKVTRHRSRDGPP